MGLNFLFYKVEINIVPEVVNSTKELIHIRCTQCLTRFDHELNLGFY